MTEKQKEAKRLVNIVYQPTGYLSHIERPSFIWEWSKNITINMIDEIKKSVYGNEEYNIKDREWTTCDNEHLTEFNKYWDDIKKEIKLL